MGKKKFQINNGPESANLGRDIDLQILNVYQILNRTNKKKKNTSRHINQKLMEPK